MTAIEIENISKQYALGKIGSGTLYRDLNIWWARMRGKPNPYLKIGQVNDRTQKADGDYVWALRDINLKIEEGEVVGIIGKNGAGKSTLLKILSRVTTPTTGRITSYGRIASLLEVGTGFHGEMTGRENIYMNGAIMGMTRSEITRKLDEIVDFAGVEKYIDTPVKRYSSGMTVRLGFAVAAFLEPEILIVDEVLAVGDAEFQKKAIGKMNDVAHQGGRTVLFVSHNMTSVKNLCNKGILLNNGQIQFHGKIVPVIEHYIGNQNIRSAKSLIDIKDRKGNGSLRFSDIRITDLEGVERDTFEVGESFLVRIDFEQTETFRSARTSRIDIGINNLMDVRITWLSTNIFFDKIPENRSYVIFEIKGIMLTEGIYNFNLFSNTNVGIADWVENVHKLRVVFHDYYKTGREIPESQGAIVTNFIVR